MIQERFITFLLQLGYSEKDITEALNGDTFSYRKQLSLDQKEQLYYKNDICVKYIYISEEHFEQRFFEKHTDIWNENDEHVFVVVSEQTTYLINAKVKPNLNSPLHKNMRPLHNQLHKTYAAAASVIRKSAIISVCLTDLRC